MYAAKHYEKRWKQRIISERRRRNIHLPLRLMLIRSLFDESDKTIYNGIDEKRYLNSSLVFICFKSTGTVKAFSKRDYIIVSMLPFD
jgi:hypothetical protein